MPRPRPRQMGCPEPRPQLPSSRPQSPSDRNIAAVRDDEGRGNHPDDEAAPQRHGTPQWGFPSIRIRKVTHSHRFLVASVQPETDLPALPRIVNGQKRVRHEDGRGQKLSGPASFPAEFDQQSSGRVEPQDVLVSGVHNPDAQVIDHDIADSREEATFVLRRDYCGNGTLREVDGPDLGRDGEWGSARVDRRRAKQQERQNAWASQRSRRPHSGHRGIGRPGVHGTPAASSSASSAARSRSTNARSTSDISASCRDATA